MKKYLVYAGILLLTFGMFPCLATASGGAGIRSVLRNVYYPKIRKISFIRPGQSHKRPTYTFGARWKLRLGSS